jgi:hypothetical protein
MDRWPERIARSRRLIQGENANHGADTTVLDLHPFACFVCRRSFRRLGIERDVAACPVCGSRAVRLSRKFKPPRFRRS